ncbi:XRE family transcriptional regulator [Aphanothece hegewaldii CCALA 016]|uniref:XRE family transcriptional regulator n=1 Tax=Aphanothece hegewaldii CCALA 016 TaxID=2107694 RepID=A0A2T1M1R1_9CHRO|nr:helix-turn-helix transcriptional regulator [Aphanothece hegewaldii]PSF38638.1 XRE family transcriptional regulator [Aphanothece hegewaldii CCALA 016]
MKEINKVIGRVLLQSRTKAKLSQEELAYRAGIHRTYVSQIERGLKSPTLSVLFKISKALNTTASNLITEVEYEINDLYDESAI